MCGHRIKSTLRSFCPWGDGLSALAYDRGFGLDLTLDDAIALPVRGDRTN